MGAHFRSIQTHLFINSPLSEGSLRAILYRIDVIVHSILTALLSLLAVNFANNYIAPNLLDR